MSINSLSRILILSLFALPFGCGGDDATQSGGQGGGPPMTFPEICDNQDNDLDGRIDEGGLQRACNSLCGGGAETCQAGRWFGCTAPMPQSEVCDNRDNDCDGRVDENVTRDCMNGCGNGSETCRLGVWGNCTAPQVGAEICDNQDNDCDGSIDENLFRACNRECSMGNQTCQQGGWSICDAASPAQEICNDGLDNDCDGTTDENCECRAGESESCSTNIGICVRGRTECRDNGRWGPCLDPGGAETTLPGEIDELCNGLDDNCNGVVDDIVPGPCGGSDIGACQRGTQTCANGVLACQGEVRPSIEVCDAQDNDCDGATDEDLMVDFYETNETCSRGEVLGPIPQNTDAPLNITATIYPDGDTDWYNLLIQEGRNFCIPNYLEIDQDYEATIQLSNIPADVDLELCVAVAAESRLISEACRGRVLVEEQCRGAEDGEDSITFTFVRRAFCQIDDSVRLLMRVRAPEDGPTFSCEPYTLSVTSRNL